MAVMQLVFAIAWESNLILSFALICPYSCSGADIIDWWMRLLYWIMHSGLAACIHVSKLQKYLLAKKLATGKTKERIFSCHYLPKTNNL